MGDFSFFNVEMFGCVVIAWILIWLMVIFGLKATGKMLYVVTLLPYVVLLVLGINGWTLDGASEGISFYIRPDISKLSDFRIWKDAATQICISLSLSYGGLIGLASYNNFNHNVMKDAVFVCLANCLTSFFSGFVVFAYLGYLAKITHQTVDKVVEGGTGLAFVVYPFAVTKLAGSPIWSILFFLVLIFLGLSSMTGYITTLIVSFFDSFPVFSATEVRKKLSITLICVGFILASAVFAFGSGPYWTEIFNVYDGDWGLLMVCSLEVIGLIFFYGPENWRRDVSIMITDSPRAMSRLGFLPWQLILTFITPVLLVGLTGLAIANTGRVYYGAYLMPVYSHVVGTIIAAIPIICFLAVAICTVFEFMIKKKPLMSLFKPDFDNFKPRLPENVKLMRKVQGLDEYNTQQKTKSNGTSTATFF